MTDPSPAELIPSWAAVVLAGGRGERLGGVDKSGVQVRGRALLEHALDCLPAGLDVLVVGEAHHLDRAVEFVREEPAYGGPVAGLAAAVRLVGTPLVGVLACDMPEAGRLLPRLVEELAQAPADVDAVVPVDAHGRWQPLCSVARTPALASALDRLGRPKNRSVRELLGLMRVYERPCDAGESRWLQDLDTWEQIREWASASAAP